MCGDPSGKQTRGWAGQRDRPERDCVVSFGTLCHAHVSRVASATHVVQQTPALTETTSVPQTTRYIAVLRLNFKYLQIQTFLLQLTTALSH